MSRPTGRPRADGWMPALAVVVPLAAYLSTQARSITWEHGGADSGEVAAAAAVLGVAHPPGYALYVGLGHLFVRALPGLEPARATNLMTAVMCAAAAGLAYRAALEACGRRDAALAAAWALALGPLWWRLATFTTPHALNLLLSAGLCVMVGRGLRRKLAAAESAAAGLLIGLAATHHPTLLAVSAAWLLVSRVRTRKALPPGGVVWRSAAIGLAVGFLPWVALPLLAAEDPAQLWGEPWHLVGFVRLVLGGEYVGYVGSASPLEHLQRLSAGIRAIGAELGPVGLPLGLLGAAIGVEGIRAHVAFAFAVTSMLVVFYAAYPARDVDGYLLPACVAMAPLVAVGASALIGASRWPAVGVGLATLPALLGLTLHWSQLDLSREREAVDFARATLGVVPRDAVVITDTDRHTFALWYGQRALGLRPDVVLVDRSFVSLGWYERQIARRHPELARLREMGPEDAAKAAGRPVYSVPSDGS